MSQVLLCDIQWKVFHIHPRFKAALTGGISDFARCCLPRNLLYRQHRKPHHLFELSRPSPTTAPGHRALYNDLAGDGTCSCNVRIRAAIKWPALDEEMLFGLEVTMRLSQRRFPGLNFAHNSTKILLSFVALSRQCISSSVYGLPKRPCFVLLTVCGSFIFCTTHPQYEVPSFFVLLMRSMRVVHSLYYSYNI